MTWARFDEAFYSHPKADKIGLSGCGLLLLSVTFSCHQLTDGEVSREWARKQAPAAVIGKLVDNGVWEVTEDGYVVHDFLKYNESRAEVLEKRALNAERIRNWRGSKSVSNAVGNTVTNSVVRSPRTRRVRKGTSEVSGEVLTFPSVQASSASQPTAITEIYEHWRQARSKNGHVRLTETRKKKIKARLKDGFSPDELKRAIDGVANDPWEDRPLHDALEVILRSPEQVEKFMALADGVTGATEDGKAAYLRERAQRESEGRVTA